jgi:hypothetical protein
MNVDAQTGDVTAWLKERCRFGRFSSRGPYLYHSYRVWCRSRNESAMLESDWRREMENVGLAKQRGGMFHGITLRSQNQNAHT